MIVELGSRYMRAGFEGEGLPTCVIRYNPEDGRRVGDYRGWIPDAGPLAGRTRAKDVAEWASGFELWRMDLCNYDVELFGDKLERVMRDTYNKYLLADAGTSRLVIVLPSVFPHPLLSTMLATLFNRWKYSGITLLPSAVMSTISAGLRSALVVDLGWEETTVTAVYEYREVLTRRSIRAMKQLMQEMGIFLSRIEQGKEMEGHVSVDFDTCEDIMTRLAWCRSRKSEAEDSQEPGRNIGVRISDREYSVPISQFSQPVEQVFFADGMDARNMDDEEMPLDALMYKALLDLYPDTRGICMSRIVFIGGGSNIPGIRKQALDGLGELVDQFGFNPVRGKRVESQHRKLREISGNHRKQKAADGGDVEPSNAIDEKLQRAVRDRKPMVGGIIRQVESLGAWAGASLITSLKVRGVVEIERERFLQHGIAGASRDPDVVAHLERRGAHGSSRPGGDRSGWTLGEWG